MRPGRRTWTAVGVCAVVLFLQTVLQFRAAMDDPWSDARLGPTLGMLHGVPLWQPHGTGPLLDMLYGPVAALTWLPAALQSTPTRVLGAGVLEALLLTVLPAAWILYDEGRRSRVLWMTTLLLGLAVVLSSPVFSPFKPYADVPALAYATLALACAWTGRRRTHPGWRWAGAAAVVAAAGSKQVMLPLVPAYLLWITVASGSRAGVHALVALAVTGSLALGAVWLAFDVDAMIAATIVGPSRHPWAVADIGEALLWASLDLAQRAGPVAALLGLTAIVVWRPAASWRARARANRWVFPLVVAVACVPTSLLGRVKLGGSANTLAFTVWFVLLALLAAHASASRRPQAAQRLLVAVALTVASVLGLRLAPGLEALPALLAQPDLPGVAFAAARRAPETIYFPFRPTAGIFADRRAYHVDSGVFFRELEGLPVSEAFVRRFLPPRLERIADDRQFFPPSLRHLPEFRRQVLDPELPGWIVLTPDETAGPFDPPELLVSTPGAPEPPAIDVVAAPGAPARLQNARLTLPTRNRRRHLRLDATVSGGDRHAVLAIEVMLRNRSGRPLLILTATAAADEHAAIAAEWPVYFEILRSATRGVALVSGGRRRDGGAWQLLPEEVAALIVRAQ